MCASYAKTEKFTFAKKNRETEIGIPLVLTVSLSPYF